MKTISFDIKLRSQIQSEENHYQGRYKVQTKGGDNVRIICWDRRDERSKQYPIVGLQILKNTNTEFITTNTKDGKFSLDAESNPDDLVLIDTWEPKFKIGDKIKYNNCGNEVYRIADILKYHYQGISQSNERSKLIPFEDDDLLELAPEESELTEFEEQLANSLYKSIGVVCMDGMEALAKEFAPKLLKVAKKEIIEKLNEE